MRGKLHIKKFVALIWINLALVLVSMSGYAQSKITGKVTGSDDGLPIPGVTVKVKGGNTLTSTNAEGVYSITASGNATLIFSFIGYASQEVAVGGNAAVNVKLSPENKALNEVVVVGYGTSKRKDLTGSVSSVSAETIAKVPVVSVDQALQGRAAGVQVTNNDASPGGNISILIRGTGSLASGGNSPLYVVDGYPLNGGIGSINPSDIASIDVLKDASATAIYGVRAANGVVIVTTKKGKKDGVQLTVDAYSAFQSRPKEYKLLNAQQFATLAKQQETDDPDKQFIALAAWNNPSALTNADWQKAIYRSGLTQNYSIGIRGGNEKIQSATSVGYYNQKGIVLGSYFKRLTLSNNLDYQPLKWLRSSTSSKYSFQDANTPFGTGSNGLGNVNQLPPTLDGGNKITNQISDGKGNYGFFYPLYSYVAKYNNPLYAINKNEYKNRTNYFLVNSSLEATIFDGLRIKTLAGINYTGYSGSFFQPSDTRLIDQYGPSAGTSGNALYSQSINSTFDWLWENTLSYDKTFGKHNISFVGGVSEQETTWNGMAGSVIPYNNVTRDLNQGTNLLLQANSPAGSNTGNGQNIVSFASQFARLSYKFADRYIITGTVRRDGSSKFAPNHQYGVFPSGAIAWKAKEESFLKSADWLYDLKFRGSYGKVGNQAAINPFQYQALYSSGSPAASSGNLGYPFGKTGGSNGTYYAGIASVQPANLGLKWETDYQTDIGTDVSFLHGELTFTVDWFNRKSKDFLLNLAAPAQSGYNFLTQNVGSMSNKGWEFAANYNHTVSGFHYGLGLTVSVIKNRLTSITSGTTFVTNFGGLGLTGPGWSTFTKTNIGEPVGEFYGYKTVGIFTDAQITAANAAAVAKGYTYYQQAKTAAGDRYYADTNGDGHVTPDDQVSLGNPQPKFFGGFNLDASYKSWDVNAYFYGVYGNKILNYQESNLESFSNRGFVGIENISQQYYQNAWTPANQSNRYARIHYNDGPYGNVLPSSTWVENGSFLKLKNLTVGYTLPSSLTKTISLSKVRFYVSSQNLFTITKYTGLDPEIGVQGGNATQNGVDAGTYPSSRFYTLGLNVTF
jgi:TonB-linked SusC/RagA family outer membrane protein